MLRWRKDLIVPLANLLIGQTVPKQSREIALPRTISEKILGAQGGRTVPGTKDHFPTILMVDDDKSNRVLLTEILGEDRYRIVHANDGEEAIELLENGEVDLVLSDVMMPGLNGFGLLRELRKSARTKTIPVIHVCPSR